jgi:hypothetical protein
MFPLPETVTHLPGLFVTHVSGLYRLGRFLGREAANPLLASPEYRGGKKLPRDQLPEPGQPRPGGDEPRAYVEPLHAETTAPAKTALGR